MQAKTGTRTQDLPELYEVSIPWVLCYLSYSGNKKQTCIC